MSFRFRLERLATAALDRVLVVLGQRDDPGALPPQHPATRILETPPLSASESMALHKVRLAREYAEGITLLVEVAAQHQTALPQAAVRNLRYLSRLLNQAEEDLSPPRMETRITQPLPQPAVDAAPVRRA